MEAIEETPSQVRPPMFATGDKARQRGLLGAAKRTENFQRRKNLDLAVISLNAKVDAIAASIAQGTAKPALSLSDDTTEKLTRVQKQLAMVDDALDKAKTDYKAIDALSKAKERLLNAWSLLTGHPRPGIARPPRSGKSEAPKVD